LTLAGRVKRVEGLGITRQGDITYTVIVVLDRQDPRLRWNMTAAVAIESQEHRPTPQN
jgi:HlyD family secretion protein